MMLAVCIIGLMLYTLESNPVWSYILYCLGLYALVYISNQKTNIIKWKLITELDLQMQLL